jgi:hypothetical protein
MGNHDLTPLCARASARSSLAAAKTFVCWGRTNSNACGFSSVLSIGPNGPLDIAEVFDFLTHAQTGLQRFSADEPWCHRRQRCPPTSRREVSSPDL